MSHPYAGNPASFPANITLLDDGSDAPNMTNFMTPIEGLADRTANLRNKTDAVDFHLSYLPDPSGGPVATTTAAFDPIALKFMMAGQGTGAGKILFEAGRGDSQGWTPMGGTSPYTGGTCDSLCRGIEPAVSNKYVYASVRGGISVPGDLSVLRMDTSANTSTITTPPLGSITDAVSTTLLSISGALTLVVGASGTPDTAILYTTDHGVTWTNTGLGFGTHVSNWLAAQTTTGAAQIVVIPEIAVAGGTAYFVSSTGTAAWTTVATGTLGLTATEFPTSLVWGADNTGAGCWILVTVDGTTGRTYRSYDGLTWAVFSNNLPSTFLPTRIAAIGRQVVGILSDASPARVVYSLDGGATWSTTNLEIVYSAAQAIAASNNAYFAATDLVVATSRCFGLPGPGGTAALGAH